MDRERFLALLTKEISEGLHPYEKEELETMLQQHANYRSEYLLWKLYWGRKESHVSYDEQIFQKVLTKIAHAEQTEQTLIKTKERKRETRKAYYVAASILLFFGIFTYHFSKNTEEIFEQEILTGSKKRTLILTDGTKVTLNAASKLIYPKTFSENNREVTLAGEAYFDIKKDAKRPFIVHTAHAKVKVLGTIFNLRAYPNETKTETSLLQGAIEVSFKEDKPKRIILKPKDKLIIHNDLPTKARDDQRKTTVELSRTAFYQPKDTLVMEALWLEDKLAFNNERLEDIALQLERKYGVSIVFESEKVKSLRFNAVFEQENIQQVFHALHLAAPFGYNITENQINIYD